jgi:hypothetical protein
LIFHLHSEQCNAPSNLSYLPLRSGYYLAFQPLKIGSAMAALATFRAIEFLSFCLGIIESCGVFGYSHLVISYDFSNGVHAA